MHSGRYGLVLYGPPVVDGVQRIQGDEAGLRVVRDPVDDAAQVAQIAAAPIARRAHSVKRQRNARGFAAAGQRRMLRRRAPGVTISRVTCCKPPKRTCTS